MKYFEYVVTVSHNSRRVGDVFRDTRPVLSPYVKLRGVVDDGMPALDGDSRDGDLVARRGRRRKTEEVNDGPDRAEPAGEHGDSESTGD